MHAAHAGMGGGNLIEKRLAAPGYDDLIAAVVKMLGKSATDTAGAASDENGVSSKIHIVFPGQTFTVGVDYPSIAGFNTSTAHWRKLVGVLDCGVRSSALSRPSFFAAAMSVMPCAIASDMPRSINPAL